MEKALAGTSTVYFSPVGLLHRLNLGAIALSDAQTLADKYHLVQLKSTRQLVVPDAPKIAGQDAVLFGGIQFDPDSTALKIEASADLAARSRGGAAYPVLENKPDWASVSRGNTWAFLPGTEREVAALEKLLPAAGIQVEAKKGHAATEDFFKNIGQGGMPSPRVLHLATHGYFFPDPKTADDSRQPSDGKQSAFKISEQPMLRSGLILAGGNAAWQGAPLPEDREDGILTAYEISQMNLANTELVVLSACETGLGDIAGNEGVYGLQRAFKIAGAKYLIMSLWQVPDKQTSMLMTTFYKKWLTENMTIPEAFRAAQMELREAGFDPYQWAGFVLME